MYTYEFLEIDKRVGWYAGASWDEIGIGHLDVLYYNNDADPTAETNVDGLGNAVLEHRR